MSAATNASKDGFTFENQLYEELTKYFADGFTLRREREVKKEYGNDITAIDFELFNNVKTKDANKIQSKHVFIQLKWKDRSSPISDINHYVKCCSDIEKQKKLNCNHVYHIYGTKVPVSGPSLEALNKLKHSDNIYISEMKLCVNTILNKILAFYGRRPVVFRVEIEDIYDDKFNYEELKKTILVELVIKRHNLKRREVERLKHSDLVNIIVSKNGGMNKVESIQEVVEEIPVVIEEPSKLDEEIMTLQFEEPEIRNKNEKKSKLLKIGSDLHIHLLKLRNELDKNLYKHDGHSIGLHTEVLNRNGNETLETFLSRIRLLEGRRYNIKDINNYDIIGKAIVFLVGELEGYERDAHITISYLPNNDSKEALQIIYNYFNKNDENNITEVEELKIEETKVVIEEEPKKDTKKDTKKESKKDTKVEVIEEEPKKDTKKEAKKENKKDTKVEVIEEEPKKDTKKEAKKDKKTEVIEEDAKKDIKKETKSKKDTKVEVIEEEPKKDTKKEARKDKKTELIEEDAKKDTKKGTRKDKKIDI
jgi:hypothetical protein